MKKNLILFGIVLIYLFLNVFYLVTQNIPFYNEIINPLCWGLIALIAFFLGKDDFVRVKDSKNKIQSLIIVLMIYLIVYFLLGLVFGYQKTPYSKNFISIVTNLWSFGSIIILQEYVRNVMVGIGKKDKISLILIVFLFTLLNLTIPNIASHFVDVKETFIYLTSTLLPLLVLNSVLTYLSYVGGYRLPIIYRLFITIPEFILPIIPNFDWFISAVIGLVVPVIIYVYLNYVHLSKVDRLSKRERKGYGLKAYIPTFIVIVIIVCFAGGFFKYQPVAIVSGSMVPTFYRGDAVVVKKLSLEEKNNLKKGDVIQFTDGVKYVVHRIYSISNDNNGNKVFITKGDANNAIDSDYVTLENVKGKVSFVIKYIGYPSVWLSGS